VTRAIYLRDVRAIFLDAVGTLIHPDPPAAEVYAEVGRRFGSRRTVADIAVRFRAAFQLEEEADRAAGWRTDEAREIERWRHIVAAVLDDVTDPASCFAELFAHFGRPQAWQCPADVGPVLTELAHRGCLLGVASNFDRRLQAVLSGLPVLAPLQPTIISSQVGWRKPAIQFFTAMYRTTGLPPAAILHIGDSLSNDYDGARAAGLQSLLYDPSETANSAKVDRITRWQELLEWVC
jgi:putative hydrolase of the HAD superfamily